VQHGFRRGDDDADVGVHERRMYAQRYGARRSDLDEVIALDVVHLDVPVEMSGELG